MSTLKITEIQESPNNPRTITKEKFDKLVKSIKEFPEMLQARPIVVSPDNIILGGNMRFRACKAAGLKKVPVYVATWDEVKSKQFVIKDNTNFGQWDWDELANDWNTIELAEWGLDVWENPDDVNDLDAELEWTDMPAFEQEDLTPSRQIIVSFRNEKDVQAFAKLLGQKITDKTKSVWHPFAENEKQFDKTYD